MELSVGIPGVKTVDPSIVRRKLAAQNDSAPDGLKIPSAIFNYDRPGHTINHRSAVRFGGGKMFRLFACGNDAVKMLSEEGHKIVRLLSMAYGSADLCEQRKSGIYQIEIAPKLRSYRIPMMVIQRDPSDYRDFTSADAKGKLAYIEALIRTDIGRSLETAGSTLEIDDPSIVFGETEVSGDIHPIEVKPGVWFLAAREVSFRINLDIKGPVHLGYLISRGYGQVFAGAQRA